MKKRNYHPDAARKANVVAVENGGTGADNIVDAVKNLGAVVRSMVGRPGGIATRDAKGGLPKNLIPEDLVVNAQISLSGPTSIDNGSTATFQITNFDTNVSYTVESTLGSFTRNADIITFVSNGTPGIGTLKIDGVTFSFYIVEEAVITPHILFPTDGSSPGFQSALMMIAESFSSNRPASTHLSSDWEISTNATFTTIAVSSYNDYINLTTFVANGLLANTTYYARTRQRANTSRVSDWSPAISFTMSTNDYEYTAPGTYTFTMAADGTVEMIGQGSGGGGGGGWDSIYHSSGLGGAGGSSGESTNLTLSLLKNDVIKVVIPDGGLGGKAGAPAKTYTDGGDGASTLIYVNDVLKLTARGGLGGDTATTGTGDNEWAYGGLAVGNGTAGQSTRSQVGAAGGNSPTGGVGGIAQTVRHAAGYPGTKGAGGGGAGPVTSWSSTLPGGGKGGPGYGKLTVSYVQQKLDLEYPNVGTFTYVIPAGYDTLSMDGVGAGGGAGAGNITDSYYGQAGHAGTHNASPTVIPVIEGDIITITVGSGGLGGTLRYDSNSGTNVMTAGTDGGSVVIKKNGTTVLTLAGGLGATGSLGASGIVPGFASFYAPGGAGGYYQSGSYIKAKAGTKGSGGGGGAWAAGGLADYTQLDGGAGGDGYAKLTLSLSVNTMKEYSVPGTYTFTMAESGYVESFAQGPGGGGGSWGIYVATSAGGGSGSSGELTSDIRYLTKGTVVSVTIPDGGNPGSFTSNGSGYTATNGLEGSPTSFSINNLAYLTAQSGKGGGTMVSSDAPPGGAVVGNGSAGVAGVKNSTTGTKGGSSPSGGVAGRLASISYGYNQALAENVYTSVSALPGTKGAGGNGGVVSYGGLAQGINATANASKGAPGYGKLAVLYGTPTDTTYLGYQNLALSGQQTFNYTVAANSYVTVKAKGGANGTEVTKSIKVSKGDIIRCLVGASGFPGSGWSEQDASWVSPPHYGSATSIYLNGVLVVTSAAKANSYDTTPGKAVVSVLPLL